MLTQAGHDTVHVAAIGLAGAPDTEVMAKAGADNRILISADTDFGELLANSAELAPSVILFRRSSRRADDVAAVLLANLDEIGQDLIAGALVVIGEQRIRIRRLPV